MRDKFIETLLNEVEVNPNIVLITGDLGFGVLDEFREVYPDNFINAGVAEQNMAGIAAGLAFDGKIVFTYSIANFPTMRCYEQIRNDICYHNLNVNIVSIGAGFSYGSLGMSHHATEDLAVMRCLPNMTMLSPSGLWETSEATRALINKPGPGFLRLDKSVGIDSPLFDNEKFILGNPRKMTNGSDCTLFVTGGILSEAQKAQKILKKKGISIKIVNIHTIKPININSIIDECNESKAIVTLEEHTIDGGLGSILSEIIADNQIAGKSFLRIGLDKGFSSVVGSQEYLRRYYKMDSESVVKKIIKLLDIKS